MSDRQVTMFRKTGVTIVQSFAAGTSVVERAHRPMNDDDALAHALYLIKKDKSDEAEVFLEEYLQGKHRFQ